MVRPLSPYNRACLLYVKSMSIKTHLFYVVKDKRGDFSVSLIFYNIKINVSNGLRGNFEML